MHIEVWSDVVCPFCYIGKRHLETALADFPHRAQVHIEYKSFELQPDAELNENGSLDLHTMLAKKIGVDVERAKELNANVTQMAQEAGLEYHLDSAIPTNTFTTHRLLHLAKKHNLQAETKECLMAAYFTESKHVGNKETLLELAQELGLPKDEVQELLNSEDLGYEVRTDQQEARELGINGVPFFIFNRKYAISGAQPVALFKEVLETTWKETEEK